jgi:hypothetical protein
MRSLILALLLLSAGCAPAKRVAPHIVLWSGTTADLVTTRMVINHGGYELNPLPGNGAATQAVFVYSIAAIVDIGATYLPPTWASNLRYIVGASHFGLAIRHIVILR